MRSHGNLVLIVCVLALSACQPAPSQAPAQTQAAQSAFNTAVAAAQTQAAPPATARPAPSATPPPVSEPAATSVPIATLLPEQLQIMASAIKGYLDGAVGGYQPPDGKPYQVQVSFVQYEYHDNGNAAVMDVGVERSNDTLDALVMSVTMNAMLAIYNGTNANAADQVSFLPPRLSVFRLHTYDSAHKERYVLTANWADVMAYGKGSISRDEFMKRQKAEQALE